MMITCFIFWQSITPLQAAGYWPSRYSPNAHASMALGSLLAGIKKPSSLKNFFSGTRACASCYHPKFTDTLRYWPYQLRTRNDSSIVYHCNGCTRRSLGIIASVRGSKTIFNSSFCACSHLIRLSVTYLTAYSSLLSLCLFFVNHTTDLCFCQCCKEC